MIPVPDHLIAAPAPRRAATPDDEAAALAAFAGRFAPRLRRLVQAQLARRGDAARQALPRTREAAAALHRDIGAGLDGAVRKRLFDRLAGGQMGIETARLERHAAAEDRAARRTASNSFLAQQMAEYQTRYGDWREMFRELDRIDRVSKGDVRRVANKIFVESNRTSARIEFAPPKQAPVEDAGGAK